MVENQLSRLLNKWVSFGISQFERFVQMARNRLSSRQFLFVACVLIGVTAGLAAVMLKTFVHYIFILATHNRFSEYRYWYLVLPLIGLALTVVVIRYVLKMPLVKGLSQIHEAIAKRSSLLPRNQMYDQVLTSSITVGFGGSTGLEAPIVITGAALGSNFSRRYKLSLQERTLMLACGIAAGIGAAFNAPIAGVLFALEVLLLDISITAFTPLILSAASGALVSKVILNEGILLSFDFKQSFIYSNVPLYVLLGLLCGLISVYHSRVFTRIEQLFHRKKRNPYLRVMIGGSLLAALILIFPALFGEGYQSIMLLSEKSPAELLDQSILEPFKNNEYLVLAFVGAIVFIKPIATAITLGSGGNGGNFAPSLFVGAFLGFLVARLVNDFTPFKVPENNFMIVGMAGILSGLYHAPLTSIFLIAEITGGYTLMIPLMLVSSISYAISRYIEPYSMDTKRFADNGIVPLKDRDTNILKTIRTKDYLETDFQPLTADANLRQMISVVSNSSRNIFPVLEDDGRLLGLVLVDEIREVMFKTELYDTVFVRELMIRPPNLIQLDEPMERVMRKFDETDTWILPVIDRGIFIGFISKTSIFSDYRKRLKKSTIS